MRNVLVGLGILLSASAFADVPRPPAPKAPVGTGNFRRAEVLEAVGAKAHGKVTVDVRGLNTMNNHVQAPDSPKNERIELVSHGPWDGARKVDIVAAPVDKSKPVKVLSTRAVHKLGLITQKEAQKLAETNGGRLGSKEKVELRPMGTTYYGGSYRFRQTEPAAVTTKDGEGKVIKATNIHRSVTVSGSGETASSPQL